MKIAKTVVCIVCSWVAAIIMAQTLGFKFMGAEESVYIFTEVGIEPWGRITVGIFELIAAILLLLPRTRPLGALLGMGLMAGAIFLHFTSIGIEVMDDGGMLFIYAVITFVCSLVVFVIGYGRFLVIFRRVFGKSASVS